MPIATELRAAVDEIAAHVADRALDFALGLRAIGPTGARGEAPVVCEAQELEIVHERAALQAQVARGHRLHLIEEHLARHAAKGQEGVLEALSSVRMSKRHQSNREYPSTTSSA